MKSSHEANSTPRKGNLYGLLAFAGLLICPVMGAAQAAHPAQAASHEEVAPPPALAPVPVQIVALDECEPKSFNDALGADFCKNVTLGAFTPLDKLFKQASDGTPDPGWDFEPDTLRVRKGTPIVVVDQGGEPHTFTEVKQFGGGFIEGLNHGEQTVPECDGGFKNIDVARTRILQGSQLQVSGLTLGQHNFQCCIHPWMRVTVEVQDPPKQK